MEYRGVVTEDRGVTEDRRVTEGRDGGVWLVTATLSGAIAMGLEVVAFRLYAPYFGYSIYVWGSMISVVMLALAAGYAIGGWLADRSTTDLPLHASVLASALYQLAIVFIAHPLLAILAEGGDFTGTALATLVIFAPSMTALATVGPFVIRLLARGGHVGTTAGRVYAWSTGGSMAGILATSFYLLPRFGTQRTLEILCASTAALGVIGLCFRRRVAILALLPFALLLFTPAHIWSSDTIWSDESAYNLIRVLRQGDRVVLLLNSRNSVHTIREGTSGWTGRYYDDFALGPLLVPAHKVLTLGMGGGGSIEAARLTAPDAQFDAIEIDPKVVEAAERFFALRPDDRLHVHVADARRWLVHSKERYDLVQIDLYHGGPYVPFYLTTVEFFNLVRSRMQPDGVLMMNVFDPGRDRAVLSSTLATLQRVFSTLAVVPDRWAGNNIVLAFNGRRSISKIREQLAGIEGERPWEQLARKRASEIVEPAIPPSALVFTDDRAPVEEMTRRMLAD